MLSGFSAQDPLGKGAPGGVILEIGFLVSLNTSYYSLAMGGHPGPDPKAS